MIGTRMTISEKIFQILAHVTVILVALACVVPFLFVVSASITPMKVLLEKPTNTRCRQPCCGMRW